MGAGATSSSFSADSLGTTLEQKMKIIVPDFYLEGAVVTYDDVDVARFSWSMIVEDASPEFYRLKTRSKGFEYRTCKLWFYDQFNILSAESGSNPPVLHNAAPKIQEKAINAMVNMLLSMYLDKTAEERLIALQKLAIVHAGSRRVHCYQYAQVAETHLKTMQKCLGSGYNDDIDAAWKRIFSATFQVLLPLAIEADDDLARRTNPGETEKIT
jgi:hemoglobin-like flavoprotein